MIPDEPTDENVKLLLEHLLLCVWTVPAPHHQSVVRHAIRWASLFDYSDIHDDRATRDVQPVPIL